MGDRNAGIPEWLFDESRDTVGERRRLLRFFCRTIRRRTKRRFKILVEEQAACRFAKADEATQNEASSQRGAMNYSQRLVYNKLISGSFRVGVSQSLVMRALSEISG